MKHIRPTEFDTNRPGRLSGALAALPLRAALPTAVVLAMGATALPVQAATMAQANLTATLGVVVPEGLYWSYGGGVPTYVCDDCFMGPPSQDGSGDLTWSHTGVGPAHPAAVPGSFSSTEPVDDVFEFSLDITASSGPAEGSAFADIELGTLFDLFNFGGQDQTVSLSLSYDFNTSASVTDPSWNFALSQAFGVLSVFTFDNTVAGGSVETTVVDAGFAFASSDANTTAVGSIQPISFTIEAGKSARVGLYLVGAAQANTTAAPIPLPAAGWLLLGGLGGLGLLGRRRKAQTG